MLKPAPSLVNDLMAEMAEQAGWSTSIPSWHPRNEGDPDETPDPPKDEEKLGDPGKAALQREREARKAAEAENKETKRRLEALEAEKLSDQQKLEKRAEDGDKARAEGTDKLRAANLRLALADKGLTGGKAKAAARLLDGVQFNGDDEPTNLDDAITSAKATYGDELFAVVKTEEKPPPEGETPEEKAAREALEKDPNLHAGARKNSKEADEDALIGDYVKFHFPTSDKEPASAAA
jgi:hypothetical protein